MVLSVRAEVQNALLQDNMLRLHWVDNFAKQYASNSMFSNRDLFKQCLWTAHGFKELKIDVDLSWKMIADDDTVAALPHIDELLTEPHLVELTMDLIQLSRAFFDESIVVLRIPLKVVNTGDPVEQAHLNSSHDDLRNFIPVDIYGDNITAVAGLMKIFRILQNMEGFGAPDHRRYGQYSLLHADMKIFWQLLRALYCYPAFAQIRHDLFLIFGSGMRITMLMWPCGTNFEPHILLKLSGYCILHIV